MLFASVLLPPLGAAVSLVAKQWRSADEGRFLAGAFLAAAVTEVVLGALGLVVAHAVFGVSPLDVNLELVVAPLVCVTLTVAALRLVFPLSDLEVVRAGRDVLAFVVACAAFVWLGSKFRGWGVVFVGSTLELLVFCVLAFFLLWRLWTRIFAGGRPSSSSIRIADA